MAQTSFQLDSGTAEAIEELKKTFNVTTNTAVIRRAIALSRIAARNSDEADNTVVMLNRNSEPFKVLLSQ